MRVIAITNQKGGVGKTTTTINLGSALAGFGYRVLIVDLDPQGNASTGLGVEPSARGLTSYDLLLEQVPLAEVVQETSFANLSVVPANADLASADIELVANEKRSFLLSDALQGGQISGKTYDYALIDCPPSLSLLTVNALVAADAVIIPLQSEFYALEGLSQLMLTIRDLRKTANQDLRIDGVVLTMTDSRNRLSQQVEEDARKTLGDLVFETTIPRNVRLSEAPSFALPIGEYDPSSKGAEAYKKLAMEVIAKRAGKGTTEKNGGEH